MTLPGMSDFYTNDGVLSSIKVTAENAEAIAKATAGVALIRAAWRDEPAAFFAVRFPTLHGNQEASIGDYVIREERTGRYSVMTPLQFEQAYFTSVPEPKPVDPREIQHTVKGDIPPLSNTESSYPNPTRNLYQERQARNGNSS